MTSRADKCTSAISPRSSTSEPGSLQAYRVSGEAPALTPWLVLILSCRVSLIRDVVCLVHTGAIRRGEQPNQRADCVWALATKLNS